MARPLRIQYEGAVYHISCRGNERKDIFKDDADKKMFLDLLKDSLKTYGVALYCYVLMRNHFHFLLETPLANLSEFMRQFNITYTSYYNRKHQRVGHLYQGRYKSIIVDKDSYLITLSRYIHLNPVRTKEMEETSLIEKEGYLKGYKWSSLPGYIDSTESHAFIDYNAVLEAYGGNNNTARKAYRDDIYSNLSKKIDIKGKIVGQSILGNDEFIIWIKQRITHKGTREIPAIKKILNYKTKDEIIKAVCEETGREFNGIIREKGVLRQILMDLLYTAGGLKGTEIGKMMGIDYSTVSRGRKRLREKRAKNKEISSLITRIEEKLSIVKI